jgi:hypothetical protein
MVQANYGASTTGEYAEGLEAALRAIQFFQPSPSEPQSEDRLYRLAMAEMRAGLASQGLLRFEEAIGHFNNMSNWTTTLAQSTNSDSAALA